MKKIILVFIVIISFGFTKPEVWYRGDMFPIEYVATDLKYWKNYDGLLFVDVSAYGAVGDGSTDDTSSIQAAFDSGNNIRFGAGISYRISQQLQIDQSGNQSIIGNDATLVITSGYVNSSAIIVNKSSGTSYIDGLNIDGNGTHLRMGYELRSSFEITNFTVSNMYMPTLNTATTRGIYVSEFTQKIFSSALLDNFTISNIKAISSDCQVAGVGVGDGSAKGIQVDSSMGSGSHNIMSNDMTISNFTIDGVWGDDADALDFFMYIDHDLRTGHTLVKNGTITNGQRRLTKTSTPNITFDNIHWIATSYNNPNISGCARSGMIEIYLPGGTTSKPFNHDIIFRNCTFDHTSDYFDKGLLIAWTYNLIIEGSTFINCQTNYKNDWGSQHYIGNIYDANSYLLSYNVRNGWANVSGFSDINNTKVSSGNWNQLYSNGSAVSAPVSCYDGIQNGDETSIDTGGNCVESIAPVSRYGE